MNRNPRSILEAVVGEQMRDGVDLSGEIEALIRRRQFARKRRRTAAAAVIALVVLAALLLVSVPGAVMAMRRLFGFIPGIGIVEQGARLRVLAEPVNDTRDGVTLTVKEAVLSSDQTIVVYSVAGMSPDMLTDAGDPRACIGIPVLDLPDGTELESHSGSSDTEGSKSVFAAIPEAVDSAQFRLACIENALKGKAPEDWSIPLRFVPAPPRMTVLPVVDVAPSPDATSETRPLLTVDRVVEEADGYILIGALHSTRLPDGRQIDADIPSFPILHFADASGQVIEAEYDADIQFPAQARGTSPWAYKISGKQFAYPLTITLEEAVASVSVPETRMEFDAGSDPQVGQVWELNINFGMDGYEARLVSVERIAGGYELTYKTDPRVAAVNASFDGYAAASGGGGGDGRGNSRQTLLFSGAAPAGRLTLLVAIRAVRVPGPWSITWQPPTTPTGTP